MLRLCINYFRLTFDSRGKNLLQVCFDSQRKRPLNLPAHQARGSFEEHVNDSFEEHVKVHLKKHSKGQFEEHSKGPFEEAFRRPIRRVHKKSIRRRQIKTNRRAGPEGIRKSKVSRFIQDSKETWIFQKRKSFNMSDSCLMALKACLIGCLLPLLDHHTPINTRASIQCWEEGNKKNKKNEKEGKTGRIWRYAAHKPTKGYQHFHK